MRHDSTIVAVDDARAWIVICNCGWESGRYGDHHQAVAAERAHIEGTA